MSNSSKEYGREYMKNYYKTHRVEILATNKRYRERNPEKIKDINKKYRSENIELCRAAGRKWRADNPEKKKELGRLSYLRNKPRKQRYSLEYQARIKDEVLAHYGRKCACCGFDDSRFLSLDHVNGDGAVRRRAGEGTGTRLYLFLKKSGWPRGFQTMCFNCNFAKGNKGKCPHQIDRDRQLTIAS